ncbi:MAG: trypsin-like peptidase domain-containing protein [bacterium]|nr:trypsin-like peptidase domain-containing protein [bacterium]
MRKYLAVAILSGVISAGSVVLLSSLADFKNSEEDFTHFASMNGNTNFPSSNTIHSPKTVKSPLIDDTPINFVDASAASTKSVVFIQTSSEVEYRRGSWMNWFFESRPSERVGSGSGVIMSDDGYIVTNNHVVEGADRIKVIHDRNSYEGKLVGRDPSTDLAVIKIEAQNLPKIVVGNSASVAVGEWVLAVGNPFNLESTVTAGIVSAKGRNINILKDKFPIESFIQTDAAINPGNSGGALVNIKGELIGINTAILSRTGSYAGYGFAVPVDIVNKVFNDFKDFGEVQKAFIGAEYLDIDGEIASKLDLKDLSGVIVAYIQDEGAAEKSGLKKGDVIRSVNGTEIKNKAYLEEIIGNSYPGDKLMLTVSRDGKEVEKNLTLTNKEGTTGRTVSKVYFSEFLKAKFEPLPKVERDLYGIDYGIRVLDYSKSGFFSELEIPEGFIITEVNSRPIEDPEEFSKIIERIRGNVIIEGITERGRKIYFPYRF